MKPNFVQMALDWLIRATGHVPIGREKSLAVELEKAFDAGAVAVDEATARAEKAEARVAELEKLAYLGEHHFPDLTYKARLEELVPKLQAAEARIAKLEAVPRHTEGQEG